MAKYLRVLREQLPEFSWETCICKAVDYMLPQTRVRVFIRGIRRCISDKVPPPLPPFGSVSLKQALIQGAPPTPRASITEVHQHKLAKMEQKLCKMVREKELDSTDLVVGSLNGRGRLCFFWGG